jgi:hypothetical protein
VVSPVMSNAERLSFDLSPTYDPDSRDQPSLAGPTHSGQAEDLSREQSNMHQHLPSLSDMFSGQRLLGGIRPSSEPNRFWFTNTTGAHVSGNAGPTLNHGSCDGRPTPAANGQPFLGNSSSHSSFGHPRPTVDGPLPIHALLTSKPEPTLQSKQPSHSDLSPYHTDQQPRLVHQLPNGAASLPMMNGASPSHHIPGPSLTRIPKGTTTTLLPFHSHTITCL